MVVSLSVTHSARFRARRHAYTSSESHDAWRNSNAARTPSGSHDTNSSSTSAFARRYGGSWNSRTPSLGPSVCARAQKIAVSSWQSRSRASWVMRRGAFSVKAKPSGTVSAHLPMLFSLGSR